MDRDRTNSRLIKQLTDIARPPAAPIGFGRVSIGSKLPAIALVVDLARNDPSLAEASLSAGADAVVAQLHAELSDGVAFGGLAEEQERLVAVLQASTGAPVGVAIGLNGETTLEELDGLASLGIDFVVVQPHRVPAQALGDSHPALVALLDSVYSGGPLRGLGELLDAAVEVIVSRPEGSLPRLTVHDVAAYRQMIDAIRRPIIACLPETLVPGDVASLHRLGIEGLALSRDVVGDTPELVRTAVAAYHEVIASLGPPLGRERARGGAMAILPGLPTRERIDDEDDTLGWD